MASTSSGWPYVQDADLPVQYPVTSLALANALQTRFGPYKILAGGGLTAANGKTTVTFSPAFSTAPFMVATLLIQNGFVVIDATPSTTTAAVTTYNHAGVAFQAYFSWIAVGI